MVHLDKLAKVFGSKPALEPLTLDIPQGEIFGLLGHNGAGKSTTFGMVLGQIHPTGGEAFVRGVSVQKNRRKALERVGAIFEAPGFYDYLSGWENLRIFSCYSGPVEPKAMQEVVRLVGLEQRIHDPVKVYSHGMRQRLALAQALLPAPDFILLDEPTEGLDPEGIHEIRNLILRLNRERGLTVLLSSHLLSEVEHLCDSVAILNQGRLVFNGKWAQLAGDVSRFRLAVDPWEQAEKIALQFGAKVVEPGHIALSPERAISDLVEQLVRNGVRVSAVEPIRPSLEQLYLETISSL